jgi:hypothetical protein
MRESFPLTWLFRARAIVVGTVSRKRRRGSVRASTLRGLRSVLYAGSRIECRLKPLARRSRHVWLVLTAFPSSLPALSEAEGLRTSRTP